MRVQLWKQVSIRKIEVKRKEWMAEWSIGKWLHRLVVNAVLVRLLIT